MDQFQAGVGGTGSSRIELVIFDCDGVLVDSERISNEVLARALTAIGLPTSLYEAHRDYQGLLLIDIVAEAEERLGRPLPDGFLQEFEADRDAQFRDRLRPVPHAASAVSRVRAGGARVCVASQGKLSKTELTLGLTGLRNLFDEDAVFSAYSVARGKPFPDLFLHAAHTMGAIPSQCVVVEDSYSGVTAARAAGMRALGYVAAGHDAALRLGGAEIIRSLDDVPGRLGLE